MTLAVSDLFRVPHDEASRRAGRRFKTQAEARIAVFEFIEGFYNPRRRHSSIGYLSPIAFERQIAANPGAHQHAVVLAAIKDRPFGRPQAGPSLTAAPRA